MTIADLPYERRQPLRAGKAGLEFESGSPSLPPRHTARPPRERSQRAPADREHTPSGRGRGQQCASWQGHAAGGKPAK